MLLSEQKPFEEIAGYLEGEKSVFILGCNGCAQSSGSGGPAQVEEMKNKLSDAKKKVTGTMVIDFLCNKALVKSGLRGKVDEVKAADSVLVMTCGVGVQAVAASINKVCHPACNTVNLGGSRGEWQGSERCQECGQLRFSLVNVVRLDCKVQQGVEKLWMGGIVCDIERQAHHSIGHQCQGAHRVRIHMHLELVQGGVFGEKECFVGILAALRFRNSE